MGYRLYSDMQAFQGLLRNQETKTTSAEVKAAWNDNSETGIKASWDKMAASFHRNPDPSNLARQDFAEDAYQALYRYHNECFYKRKGFWATIGYFLRIRSKEEREILNLRNSLETIRNTYKKAQQRPWYIPWFMRDKYEDRSRPNYYRTEEERVRSKIRGLSHRLLRNLLISSKDLEGFTRDEAAYKIQRELKKFKNAYERELSDKQKRNLSACINSLQDYLALLQKIKLSEAMARHSTPDEIRARHADIEHEVRAKLMQLKPGQKYIMPHGYNSEEGGHGAIVEFYRNADGTYSMCSIDSGEGQVSTALLSWQANVRRVPNITVNEILQTSLITDLLKPVLVRQKTHGDGRALMRAPFDVLSGRIVTTNARFDLQINGTCAHDCVMSWLQVNLESTLFSCYKFFVISRNLEKLRRLDIAQKGSQKLHAIITDLTATNALIFESKGEALITRLRSSGEDMLRRTERTLNDEIQNAGSDMRASQKAFNHSVKESSKDKVLNRAYEQKLAQKVEKYKAELQEKQSLPPEQEPTDRSPSAAARVTAKLFGGSAANGPDPQEKALYEKYKRSETKLSAVRHYLHAKEAGDIGREVLDKRHTQLKRPK